MTDFVVSLVELTFFVFFADAQNVIIFVPFFCIFFCTAWAIVRAIVHADYSRFL